MQNWRPGQHLQCLDTFRVESASGAVNPFRDCAILLEIWETGGLLQTSIALPENTHLNIPSIGHGVSARVVSCQQDDYGFLEEIEIVSPEWFPQNYTPPYLIADGIPG